MALSSSTSNVYSVFKYFGCGARPEVERFGGNFRPLALAYCRLWCLDMEFSFTQPGTMD